MRKDQLVATVQSAILAQAPTQDSGKHVHPQEVEMEVAKAYETAVIQFFAESEMAGKYDLDYYAKTVTVKVKHDHELYVELPLKPLALAGGMGIRMVKPAKSNVLINRISEAEFTSLRHLEAWCCSPEPFCYISGNRIVLQGNRPEYDLLDEVDVKIIPKFTEFDDSDEINCPGGDYALTRMVLEVMGLRLTDQTNDDLK